MFLTHISQKEQLGTWGKITHGHIPDITLAAHFTFSLYWFRRYI